MQSVFFNYPNNCLNKILKLELKNFLLENQQKTMFQ